MLLKEEYEKIYNFISDANAGGRKNGRVQDHILIINLIIFEHARHDSSTQVTIGIYDCEQGFDSLWQDEVINKLYDAGLRDFKLALLQKLNNTNHLAIKHMMVYHKEKKSKT